MSGGTGGTRAWMRGIYGNGELRLHLLGDLLNLFTHNPLNYRAMTHELKIAPNYYRDIMYEGKTFEVRYNDRNFKVGDTLILKEWNGEKFTGREIVRNVQYILSNFTDVLHPDYVIMSIK